MISWRWRRHVTPRRAPTPAPSIHATPARITVVVPSTFSRRRRNPFLSLQAFLFLFLFSLGPVLSSHSLTLPPLSLPFHFLFCHSGTLFLLFLFALLALSNAFHPRLLLFFAVKSIAFLVIRSCSKCTGHFVQLNPFSYRYSMRV
jgi:hypothetical protein